jgi:hypothetical protein
VGSDKPKLFFLKFKSGMQVKISKVTSTMFDMIDNFFLHFNTFDRILSGVIPNLEDVYSPVTRRIDIDPLGLANIMKSLKPFEYSRYNPVYVNNRSIHEILNDGAEDRGDGRVEVAVDAHIGLSDYERQCYRYLHDSNMIRLTKDDTKRQYMRFFDDEKEYTMERPVGEEQNFTWYFLPTIVPGQMDRIVRYNRTILPELWEQKKMFVERSVSIKGVPLSATFEDLANTLRIRTSEFSSKNNFAKSISLGRGTAWIAKYMTTLLWNRWFVMNIELDFNTFDLGTLVECFCMKMLCSESSLTYTSRNQVNNYISKFFFSQMKGKGLGNQLDGFFTEPAADVALANRYMLNETLVDSFDGFAIRCAAEEQGRDEIRQACHRFFGTWCRGVRVAVNEIPGINEGLLEDVVVNLPQGLNQYHTNRGPEFVAMTEKEDVNWEDLWQKSRDLEIIIKSLERGGIIFSNRDPRVNQDLVFMIARLNKQIYDLQGFAIDFNALMRKMAFIPDTQMLREVESREYELNQGGQVPVFKRSIIDIGVGDVSSAYLATRWSDASLSMPVQDLCDDAWMNLQSFDEFKANYDVIRDFARDFVVQYPTYFRFFKEPQLIDLAWKHTRVKHPLVSKLAAEFQKYNNRIFTRFDEGEIEIDALRQDKMNFVMERWMVLLKAGYLGVQDRFVLKPRKRTVDEKATFIFRWLDVFTLPADSPMYGFQDYIDAVKVGIASAAPEDQQVENTLGEILSRDNTQISGVWVNVNVSGESYYGTLDSILQMAEQIPVMGINVPYKWKNLNDHIELGLYRNLPEIGLIKLPMRPLDDKDWLDPWYVAGSFSGAADNTMIQIRHPFDIVLKIERKLRV